MIREDPDRLTRRDFLKTSGMVAWGLATGCVPGRPTSAQSIVNDIHSQLNLTRVDRIVPCASPDDLIRVIRQSRQAGKPVCVAGGRHAMGSQQFGTDCVLMDTTPMKRIVKFDAVKGIVEVEAGIMWPDLIQHLISIQSGHSNAWGIAQKQTGADRMTIGGALSANIHGRGLKMKPFVADVESFVLIDPWGNPVHCSRTEQPELFRLAIGGYGLFGALAAVTLRLVPRQKVRRWVEVIMAEDLMAKFEQRIADGFTYGDFQYSIDEASAGFLKKGIFSTYQPVDPVVPVTEQVKEMSYQDWENLLLLAHEDEDRAYRMYSDFYLSTSGQVYWSDLHQLSIYPDNYHLRLDARARRGGGARATEVISEIYVQRPHLAEFLDEARTYFLKHEVDNIYGTIRLIERDAETFLPWAKDRYVCIIFNIHTVHTPAGIDKTHQAFRALLDMAIKRGGSFYPTYRRFAERRQIETCYPQFQEFLRLKKQYDPDELFQSNWYRHYKQMFG